MSGLVAGIVLALVANATELAVVEGMVPGETPIDTLVKVRGCIQTAQNGNPRQKVLVDADFGPSLNAEVSKFDNGHTVFWRGSATKAEAIARAESVVVLPRAAIGVPRPRDADWWWKLFVNGVEQVPFTEGSKPKAFPLRLKKGANEILIAFHCGMGAHTLLLFDNL